MAPPATGEDQERLPGMIKSIECGGPTNLSGGWLRGRDLEADNRREGGVNRVLLLTDGQANVGLTEPSQLVGLCRQGAKDGVSTTTIGFGEDCDEDLEGLLSIAAQNVRVTVEPGADAEFVKVLHEYPTHAEGPVLTLEVGNLYAREPRRILMQFLLPPDRVGAGGVADVARVTVTAHVITEGGGVELQKIALPITVSPEEGRKTEPEIRKEILLVEAARLRQEAL